MVRARPSNLGGERDALMLTIFFSICYIEKMW